MKGCKLTAFGHGVRHFQLQLVSVASWASNEIKATEQLIELVTANYDQLHECFQIRQENLSHHIHCCSSRIRSVFAGVRLISRTSFAIEVVGAVFRWGLRLLSLLASRPLRLIKNFALSCTQILNHCKFFGAASRYGHASKQAVYGPHTTQFWDTQC